MWRRIIDGIKDFYDEFLLVFQFIALIALIGLGSWVVITLLPLEDDAPALPPEPAVVRSQDDTGMFVVYINVNGKNVPCIVYPASETRDGWGDCLPELVK